MNEIRINVAIIGGGPAGLAAAAKLKKLGIDKILIIDREEKLGGILKQCIHNGFGLQYFKEDLTGPEYAYKFINKIEELGVEYIINTSVIDIKKGHGYEIYSINETHGLIKYRARTVILAMGCRERSRGAILIPGARCGGIMSAGSAQRLVNIMGYLPGKKIVILGSGDIGMIMARRFTLEGAEVIAVLEILDYLSGSKRNYVQCIEDFKIPIYFNQTIYQIYGHNRVKSIDIAQVDKNQNPIKVLERKLNCDTIIFSVGLIPENELSRSIGLQIDPVTQGPIVDEYLETSIPGIFSCGNVLQVSDLVDYVSKEGEKAAEGVMLFLNGNMPEKHWGKKVLAEGNIKYVLPQRISFWPNKDKFVEFSFRSKHPAKNITIRVYDKSKIIYENNMTKIVPGEMEKLKVKKELLLKSQGDINFSIYEKE